MSKQHPSKQHGMALIVGLIMLVLITLVAVATFNMGKTSLEIVGNMQQSNAAMAAASVAIEDAISTTRLFKSPTAIYLNPCGAANTKCIDVDGDGITDQTVSLVPTPTCVRASTIPNQLLDFTQTENAGCAVGQSQSFGIENAVSGDSLCANSVFEITAVVSDGQSRTQLTQGAAVRVAVTDVATSCP